MTTISTFFHSNRSWAYVFQFIPAVMRSLPAISSLLRMSRPEEFPDFPLRLLTFLCIHSSNAFVHLSLPFRTKCTAHRHRIVFTLSFTQLLTSVSDRMLSAPFLTSVYSSNASSFLSLGSSECMFYLNI